MLCDLMRSWFRRSVGYSGSFRGEEKSEGCEGGLLGNLELSSDLGWFLVAVMSLCILVAKCRCAEVATDQI